MKIKPVVILLSFFLLTMNFGLAAKVNLKFQETSTGLVLSADLPIRFFVDYTARTLIIPEAALENAELLPLGVKAQVRSDGLILAFAKVFQVNLSATGKLLTVTGGINDAPDIAAVTPTTINTEGTQLVIYRLVYANPSTVSSLVTQLYNVKVQIDERQRADARAHDGAVMATLTRLFGLSVSSIASCPPE